MVLTSYLPHILEEAMAKENEDKVGKLFKTNTYTTCLDRSPWASVHLDHPATFDTVVMELDAKGDGDEGFGELHEEERVLHERW